MVHYAMINRIFQETNEGLIQHSAASRILHLEPGAMDSAGFFLEEMFVGSPASYPSLPNQTR
jgi:hypothetical protein